MLETNKTPYQFDMSFPKDSQGDVSHVQYSITARNTIWLCNASNHETKKVPGTENSKYES